MSTSGKTFQSTLEVTSCNQRAKSCKPFGKERIKKFYFTTGHRISEENLRNLENEIRNPYRIPQEPNSLETAKKIWKDLKNSEKINTQFGYHTRESRMNCLWKLERLYVADDVKLPGKSITDDIDPDYFTAITGRPIKITKRIRDYLKDIRNCFLTRLKTGFRLDEVLLLDEIHINEKRKMAEIKENFLTCLKSFEAFLKEDHVSSLNLLETAKEETKKSKEKMIMINKLKEELKVVQAEVLVVEERWRTGKMFQRFLYLVSPSDWRQIHDPEFGRKDLGSDSSDPCLFNREFPGDAKVDLNVKILDFKEDVKESKPPTLYFTHPDQIENILFDLERKNLIALAQCKDLDFPAENMSAEVEKAKICFEQDQASLEEEIKFLRILVQEEETKFQKNEQILKETAFGLFRNLITNEEHLTVTSYIEDAYEDAVGLNDSNLDMITMMKEIELKYESILIALDCLPNDIMIQTTKQFYKEQKRNLKEAREAEKKVRQMETLSKRLKKSLEPPVDKSKRKERKMMARSTPPEEQMHKYQKAKIPTEEEKERLFLFGNESENGKLYRPLCA